MTYTTVCPRLLLVSIFAGLLLTVPTVFNLENAANAETSATSGQVERTAQTIRKATRPVTVIKKQYVSKMPMMLDAVAVDAGKPQRMKADTVLSPRPKPRHSSATKIRAVPSKPKPPGMAGSGKVKQAPEVKLKMTLSPDKPYRVNGRLSLSYPNSVGLSQGEYVAMFSKGNIPGMLSYTVKLKKDRKYLIELDVSPSGSSGGNLRHSIADAPSDHTLGKFNEIVNISRVVISEEDGWVSGWLIQGNSPVPPFWKFHALRVTEMD